MVDCESGIPLPSAVSHFFLQSALDRHWNLPILEALSFWLQQTRHEAIHPSPSNSELQNEWRYTSTLHALTA
jgi:hypothetical protein